MIIGLSGKKQSGKSTITNYLVEKYNFVEVSWAGPLKKIIGRDLLGLTDKQLYGTEEDKEKPDKFWGKSSRELLQLIGTECFRNIIDPDFWVKVGIRNIQFWEKQKQANVVVSDCRFPNEVKAIEELGGKVIRIIREDLPSTDTHASEVALDTYPFEYIVSAKSGHINSLEKQINKIINAN